MAKKRNAVPVDMTTEDVVETPVAPVDPLADVIVKADAIGTPEGAPPEKPDHIMPKPTFTLLPDGRYRENRFDHSRTVTIDGQQYEHVAEDADGRWIYQRS